MLCQKEEIKNDLDFEKRYCSRFRRRRRSCSYNVSNLDGSLLYPRMMLYHCTILLPITIFVLITCIIQNNVLTYRQMSGRLNSPRNKYVSVWQNKNYRENVIISIINARHKVKGVRHDPTSSRHDDALKFLKRRRN